jgi:DeoR family suf operon transcriptional repressor
MNAPIPSPISTLPSAWQDILRHIKTRGEARAEDLAAQLGITVSGVRQHLTAMARDGLVFTTERREGPGRPKHYYGLTTFADSLFPRAYAALTNELLSYLDTESPEMVERIFQKRGERRLEGARQRTAGLPFRDQVRELATILDEDGYLADCEEREDGTFVITEHNCAVLGVAKRFGHACSSEIAFLRGAIPSADVTRISHMLAGGHVCAYEVKPRTAT